MDSLLKGHFLYGNGSNPGGWPLPICLFFYIYFGRPSPTELYGEWPQTGLLGGGKLMGCTPSNARHPTLNIIVMIPLRAEGVRLSCPSRASPFPHW